MCPATTSSELPTRTKAASVSGSRGVPTASAFGMLVSLVRQDASPQTGSAPDSLAQRLELYDLTVVDEEIHFRTVMLGVPREHFRIRRLEHDPVEAELVDEPGRHIGSPGTNMFSDACRFDHDLGGSRAENSSC